MVDLIRKLELEERHQTNFANNSDKNLLEVVGEFTGRLHLKTSNAFVSFAPIVRHGAIGNLAEIRGISQEANTHLLRIGLIKHLIICIDRACVHRRQAKRLAGSTIKK
jgi:hypothetical protein